MKVKIYGAGSIGNHLAHACRDKGWEVLICDIDPEALERTKNDIYPARYGHWDKTIRLATLENLPDEEFDIVIVGTPPDTHLRIAKSYAISILEELDPQGSAGDKFKVHKADNLNRILVSTESKTEAPVTQ